MHSSYKKRLYTNALSISTAVLLAFLAQGQVAADTVEPASPAAPVENAVSYTHLSRRHNPQNSKKAPSEDTLVSNSDRDAQKT